MSCLGEFPFPRTDENVARFKARVEDLRRKQEWRKSRCKSAERPGICRLSDADDAAMQNN